MIDMHAHCKPARSPTPGARAKELRIQRNDAGVEVLKSHMSEEPLAQAFDDVDLHLSRMDRQGVTTSVLSVLRSIYLIESQPLDR